MEKTGVIFGQIIRRAEGTPICKSTGATYEYEFSSGAKMVSKKKLELSSWHFFKVRVNRFGGYSSVSHCELGSEATELASAYDDLVSSATQVQMFWNKLESSDRQLVIRTVGIGMAGATAAGFAWGGVTTLLAEEALLGAATGGLSLVASAGFAAFTYLQYEERKEALARHIKTLESFMTARKRLSYLIQSNLPAQYRSLEPVDPVTKGIVTKAKTFIKSFDWTDLNNLWAEKDFAYATA